MTVKTKIQALSNDHYDHAVQIRRHLHMHPELSFQEKETAAFIAAELTKMGVSFQADVAGFGIVATIEGQNKGPEIALRADMDALPIQEVAGRQYGSKNVGIMHACGHDVHSASVLTTASILQSLRSDLNGTVRILFQPAEEMLPGGASLMIEAGALKNPVPKSIMAQHVHPLLDVGKVGFRSGMYMASTDEIHAEIIGKGGHAAAPHLNIDPVLITSHIIVALQQMVSRFIPPALPSVLSFGRVIADGATNVIPEKVVLKGTFRMMDEEWRAKAHTRILEISNQIAQSMGGECKMEIRKGYPFLKNEPELTQRCKIAAIDYLGKDNVVDLDLWMGGEDFAYYSHEIPATFYRLGVRNEKKGITSAVHTSDFDIDEDALKVGAGLMAYLAFNEINSIA